MSTRTIGPGVGGPSAASLLARGRRDERGVYLALLTVVVVLTPLLVMAGLQAGFAVVLALLPVLIIAALVVLRPLVGFYVVAACAVIIEMEPLEFADGTDRLYVFYWPANLAGLVERPIGFLMLFIFLFLLCRRLAQRQGGLRGGELLLPFIGLLLTLAMAVANGLATGGDFKTIVMELRPFEYLFLSYLLAYNLVTDTKHVRAFFWLVIVGAGIKAGQGVYIVIHNLHGHLTSGQNQIMSHEESFFFVALILLIVLFLLHHRDRRQLIAALAILPFVVIALVANNRRADYTALIIGVVFAWVLVIAVRPAARAKLTAGLVVGGLLLGGYVLAFGNSESSFAQPARAIVSVINPNGADARDSGSNQYRNIENYDLLFTEKLNPLLGFGFGKPFLQPVILPDIGGVDPVYLYVPHNTIYWVWMRAGPLGFFALWFLLGSIIVRGSIIARRRLANPYLQLVAIYVVSVTAMEIVVAYADYQLFFYRNVIYLGLLAGILMKLPQLDAKLDAKGASPAERTAPTPAEARQLVPAGGM